MNLEEYLTPVEEVEHMKAALAYYDDQNLWCCFTADDTCGAMRQKRAVATAMAKELISFTRDSEPSSTGTWQTEWPYAVCMGQDGGSNASVVWEYCQVVGVAALPPPSSSSSSSSLPSTSTECDYERSQTLPHSLSPSCACGRSGNAKVWCLCSRRAALA